MNLLTDTLRLYGNLHLARKKAIISEVIGTQLVEITAICQGLLLTPEFHLWMALLTVSKIKFAVPEHRTLFKYLNAADRAYNFKKIM